MKFGLLDIGISEEKIFEIVNFGRRDGACVYYNSDVDKYFSHCVLYASQ